MLCMRENVTASANTLIGGNLASATRANLGSVTNLEFCAAITAEVSQRGIACATVVAHYRFFRQSQFATASRAIFSAHRIWTATFRADIETIRTAHKSASLIFSFLSAVGTICVFDAVDVVAMRATPLDVLVGVDSFKRPSALGAETTVGRILATAIGAILLDGLYLQLQTTVDAEYLVVGVQRVAVGANQILAVKSFE